MRAQTDDEMERVVPKGRERSRSNEITLHALEFWVTQVEG
jgi:hypothetical protein